MKKKEQLLNSQQIYEGRALKLRVDTVKKPSGRETTREIVVHDDCVAIIAIDPEDNILLVRQYRQATGKMLLEIPAGGIDTGETPPEAVCRELQEETGYFPRKVELIGGFYSAPGYCTEYLYLFLATDLIPKKLEAEDTEMIEVVRVPRSSISELISSNEICDSKSIAGLLSTQLRYSNIFYR